ncbi:hypothetical protein D3C72_2570060 [compost metagenome]
MVAGRIESLGELRDRGRLAARRPPMGYFKIGRICRAERQRHRYRQSGRERT